MHAFGGQEHAGFLHLSWYVIIVVICSVVGGTPASLSFVDLIISMNFIVGIPQLEIGTTNRDRRCPRIMASNEGGRKSTGEPQLGWRRAARAGG